MSLVRDIKDFLAFRQAKAISTAEVRHPGRVFSLFDFSAKTPATADMENRIGDGTASDVLMTPISWLQNAMAEAPLVELDKDGNPKAGALQALLDNPNPFYSMDVLLAGLVYSLAVDGNAYIVPAANGAGKPVELWYMPHTALEPKWPDSWGDPESLDEQGNKLGPAPFISHYEWSVDGKKAHLAPEDVIHIRATLDPKNIRKGLSPIRGLLREIWTDDEAAMFTASLLRNGAVPGLVVSPAMADYEVSTEDKAAIKAHVEGFKGERKGTTMVLNGPTKVDQFGFSPQELDLSALRDVPEERVCAALGVRAAVVGFGAGLNVTKVGATMNAEVKLSWTQGVIPRQSLIASELSRALAPVFGAGGVAFDNSNVDALSENTDAIWQRADRSLRSGAITRGEFKELVGMEPGRNDDVYVMPFSTVVLPAGEVTGPGKSGLTVRRSLDQEWWDEGGGAKHHGSLLERRIIETAPQREAPPAVAAFAASMERLRAEAPPGFASALERVFLSMGQQGEAAARELVGDAQLRSGASTETKAFEDLLEVIMAGIDFATAREETQAAFELGFSEFALQIQSAVEASFGIDFIMSDPAQLAVLQEGGLRAGLIDLDQQTRDALFDTLAEARAEGLAGDNLARRIRDSIEAGPWRDVQTRARVIARTEGAHAANTATLQAARSMDGVERMMVHDNRTGHDDAVCSAIDGRVVTIQEAEAMGLAHPNCTRSFTPLPPLLLEELGL